jgi:hypothetical protein
MFKKISILMLSLLITLSLTGFAAAFKLPDTGQTKCYDSAAGTEISCAGTGQDGAYNINPMSYTDNGDGTVTDNNTGLMWQKCTVGQNNDSMCSGTGTIYNWYQASGTYDTVGNPSTQNVCGELTVGGHSDWRLPSKKELINIVDYSIPKTGPAIKTAFFPNTYTSGYWSSTLSGGFELWNNAWRIGFEDGYFCNGDKLGTLYVRCVRGGPSPSQNFVDNGDGTVTDITTGLMWQQAEPGAMAWGNALSYCQGLPLGGHYDWRLPNVKEIESLFDDSRINPAINTSYFPNVHTTRDYWASTSYAYAWAYAWGDNFYFGIFNGINDKSYSNYIRCVRGGQGGLLDYLTVNFSSGMGTGTVSGTGWQLGEQVGFSYNTGYSILFDNGTLVDLNASPADFSLFTGWTGCDSVNGIQCTLTMNADRTVTANFDFNPALADKKALISDTSSYYATLQAAYDNAPNPATIKAGATGFSENLTCAQAKNVILKGGYNEGYTSNTGYTTLQGMLTIQFGSLTVERLVIK